MIGACNGLHRSELVNFVDVLTVRRPFVPWPWWTRGGARAYRSHPGHSTTLRSASFRFPMSRE
jgi:hypothetical protein